MQNSIRIGTDIVEFSQISEEMVNNPNFAHELLTKDEMKLYEALGAMEKVTFLAGRYAAKEAVLKALGTGFSEGIGWLDVEVRRTSKGRPYVVLTGRAREVAREQGVREIPLSLSYTHTDAVACAMAITEESVAATERRRDPMEELTRQFKDARALLDDLPGALAAG